MKTVKAKISPQHTLACLAAVTLVSSSAWAQTPPNAGTLTTEQQRLQTPALQRLQSQGEPEAIRPPMEEKAGVKVKVKGFRFTGIQGVATESELNQVVRDAIGKELNLGELRRLADRITQHLKDNGWFLARAYLPRQEIKDGVVEIAVVAGRLDGDPKIKVISPHRIKVYTLEGLIRGNTSATPGQPLRNDNLERGLLLANDLPGVSARSVLEPGSSPGTVKMRVEAQEGPLFGGSVWGDTYGNRYTGLARANGLLQVNDPLSYGDQLSLMVTGASGYTFGQGTYTAPLGNKGLKGYASYSEMRYTLDRDLLPLDYDGGARTFSAGLRYPLLRSRLKNLWIAGDDTYRMLWDKTSGVKVSDKTVNTVSVSANGDMLDRWWGGGYSTLNVGLGAGRLDLSGVAADLATDRITAHSDGSFSKATYAFSRLQKLYQRLNLFASLTGQQAFDNLDSSEKFSLGGPSGVRAYPVGEATGDSGRILTCELRYDLKPWATLGVPQVVAFYDAGWTELHHSPWANSGTALANLNSYWLSGAGLGFNLAKDNLYDLKLAWATTLGNNPGRSLSGNDADGLSNNNRFWLQGQVRF
ncbi:MAG: hypothetical protein M0T76_05225 [Desulfobacteraceae bacterium]|nr:hypothetical protein [Desulfobacteraceae bacterium]